MIEINVERNQETKHITSFTISGHANAGPYGYDLVCAAVSALSIGTVNAVAKLCDVKLPIESGKKGGYLRCEIPNDLTKSVEHDIQLLIEGMLVGLHDIAEEYSRHMTIRESQA
ncbi:ribosomal-processing cysteine protease Prp [Pueribacillus sp. YX66]|uniref:ribosomal-processing cysteine protease Prp n=1 Tax=Pueribacillus sp. YX66 TaxID=3229242 RepID=UPI00358D3E32